MKKLNKALTMAMLLTLGLGSYAYAHTPSAEGEETEDMDDCATDINVSARRNSGKSGDSVGSSSAKKAVKKANRSGSANDQAPATE